MAKDKVNHLEWIYFKSDKEYYRIQRYNLDKWVNSGWFFNAKDIHVERLSSWLDADNISETIGWDELYTSIKWKPKQNELTTFNEILEDMRWKAIS